MSFRENLMAALEVAVNHYNGGMSDNEAVVKAAADAEFNADQTQRLVESFNSAKSIYFLKFADDRRDQFTLAEADKVLPALFKPSAPAAGPAKKAAAGLYDYSAYNVPEPYFGGQFELEPSGMRSWAWPTVKKASDYTLDGLHRALRQHVKIARQFAERCDSTAQQSEMYYGDCLRKLAAFIKQDYHEPKRAADVEHYYWTVAGREIAGPVTDDLFSCLSPAFAEKRATDDLERLPSDFDSRYPEMAKLAEESMTARFAVSRMKALSQTFSKEAGDLVDEWNEITGFKPPEPDAVEELLMPEIAKRAQAAPGAKPPAAPKPKPSGGTSPLGALLGGGMKVIGGGMAEGVKKPLGEAMGELFGGAEEKEEAKLTERLRNLQRQMILEDLITNDPILGGENPQAVATAYKTLVNLAPDVSLQKEVARAAVRTAVNAVGMSPFDAKMYAEMENEMRKQLTSGREGGKKK